jgi:hypothetical protein
MSRMSQDRTVAGVRLDLAVCPLCANYGHKIYCDLSPNLAQVTGQKILKADISVYPSILVGGL